VQRSPWTITILRNENGVKSSKRKTNRIGWNVAKGKCAGVKRGQRVRDRKIPLECFFSPSN